MCITCPCRVLLASTHQHTHTQDIRSVCITCPCRVLLASTHQHTHTQDIRSVCITCPCRVLLASTHQHTHTHTHTHTQIQTHRQTAGILVYSFLEFTTAGMVWSFNMESSHGNNHNPMTNCANDVTGRSFHNICYNNYGGETPYTCRGGRGKAPCSLASTPLQ